MKETTEFFQAGFFSVNSYAEAKKDGKLDGNDIQFLLPLFFKWQAGIKNLKFAQEAATATPAQIDAAFDTAAREMTSAALTPEFKYAFKKAAHGYYCTYWGLTKEAFEAGRRAALLEAKQIGVAEALKKYSIA